MVVIKKENAINRSHARRSHVTCLAQNCQIGIRKFRDAGRVGPGTTYANGSRQEFHSGPDISPVGLGILGDFPVDIPLDRHSRNCTG